MNITKIDLNEKEDDEDQYIDDEDMEDVIEEEPDMVDIINVENEFNKGDEE